MTRTTLILLSALVFSSASQLACGAASPGLHDETVAVVNGARTSLATLQTLAELSYDAHHRIEFETARESGWPKEKLRARVGALRLRWAPLWAALDVARAVHGSLLRALDENAPAWQVAALAAKLSGAQRDAAALLEKLTGKGDR